MSREEGGWRVSVRKGRSKRRFDFSRYEGFSYRKDGKYAFHWERSGLSRAQADFYLSLARSDGYEARAVEAAFERSSDYRKGFLESDPGPWRCRYCHRRLPDASEMTVDHVVPVAAANDPSLPAGRSRGGFSPSRGRRPSTTPPTSRPRARSATRARGRSWACGP